MLAESVSHTFVTQWAVIPVSMPTTGIFDLVTKWSHRSTGNATCWHQQNSRTSHEHGLRNIDYEPGMLPVCCWLARQSLQHASCTYHLASLWGHTFQYMWSDPVSSPNWPSVAGSA